MKTFLLVILIGLIACQDMDFESGTEDEIPESDPDVFSVMNTQDTENISTDFEDSDDENETRITNNLSKEPKLKSKIPTKLMKIPSYGVASQKAIVSAVPKPTAQPTYGQRTAVPKPTAQPTYGPKTAVPKPTAQPTYGQRTAVPKPTAQPTYGQRTAVPSARIYSNIFEKGSI